MKTSSDQPYDDPVVQRANQLMRDAGPALSPDLKRRVWVSLERAQTWGHQPRRFARLRPFAAAAAIVCAAGTAGAVIAHRRGALAPLPAARPAVLDGTPARSQPPQRPRQAEPVADAPATRVRPAAPRASITRQPGAAVRERSEVLDAMVVLRRAHDPVRAGAMLERYLAGHPRGALREEALALAIEAADARGDAGAARAWAKAYQTAYPAGRFGEFARHHVEPAPGH
jgi:hypothetical protein